MNYLYFVSFNLKFVSLIFYSTALTCLMCSFFILEWIITLSRYISTNFLRYDLNILFINLWKMAGTLHNPNGITLNWYCPILVKNAIFFISCFLNHTCQYAEARSKVVNHLLFQNWLHVSLILDSEYLSSIIILFNSL